MLHHKKGMMNQSLLYIIGLVIFVLILLIGFLSLNKVTDKAQEGIIIDFEKKISKTAEITKNEYGSSVVEEFELSEEMNKVCFVDAKNHKEDIIDSPFIDEYPIIKDNLLLNITDNLYFYSDNFFLHSNEIDNLCIKKSPHFFCIKPGSKFFDMRFTSKKGCSDIRGDSESFEVNENNIKNASKYGDKTLVIYKKPDYLRDNKTEILRLFTSFMYKNSSNRIIINPIIFFDNPSDELDNDQIYDLKLKYSADKIYYYNSPPSINRADTQSLNLENLEDYLSFWETYYEVVVMHKNDPDFLIGAIFASNINAPLIFFDMEEDYEYILGLKKILLINNPLIPFTEDEKEKINDLADEVVFIDGEELKMGLYFSELTGIFVNPLIYLSSNVSLSYS